MLSRIIFLTLMIVLGQNDYGLRLPSAEAYALALPEIVWQMHVDSASGANSNDESALRIIIEKEFSWRYKNALHDLPFDTLAPVEPYLATLRGYGTDMLTYQAWHTLLLNAWLREEQPDLSAREQWEFGAYTLNVQPIDFTGDGVDELAAELRYQDEVYYEYLVLQHDSSRLEGYSRLGLTPLWFTQYCNWRSGCGGDGVVQAIEDITGDDVPDWITRRGECGYGICAVSLTIFSWQNGEFRDIVPSGDLWLSVAAGGGGVPIEVPQDGWTFANVDDDAALEISETENLIDNRGCEFAYEVIYDWDATSQLYVRGEALFEYADTPWCALRQAHDAMLDRDFDTVIRHYEHFLTFEPPTDLIDVWAYARVRLAAAYALAGQSASAQTTLASIETEAISDELILTMVESAQATFAEDENALELCAALYNVFVPLEHTNNFNSLLLKYGSTNDYAVSSNYVGGTDFGKSSTGCPLEGLWNATLSQLDPTTPLVEQIEAAGWRVTAMMEPHLRDSAEAERLLWVYPLNFATFFWLENGALHQARMNTDPPGVNVTITTTTLPNDQNALVALRFNPNISECPLDSPITPGYVRLWRFDEEGKLWNIGSWLTCQPQTLAETFPRPGQLHLLATPQGSQLLKWDAATTSYQMPAQEENHGTQFPCYTTPYQLCLNLQNPEDTLQVVDKVLATAEEQTRDYKQALHYMRAWSLERLERPDEALVEYTAVYEAAPKSAWGQLAALHLEFGE